MEFRPLGIRTEKRKDLTIKNKFPFEKVADLTVSIFTSLGKCFIYRSPLISVDNLTRQPLIKSSAAKAWAGNMCPPVPPAANIAKGLLFTIYPLIKISATFFWGRLLVNDNKIPIAMPPAIKDDPP